MNNYPEEIRKQAEELIEKHLTASIPMGGQMPKRHGGNPTLVNMAIHPAIVSCEFAMKGPHNHATNTRYEQLKSYLEELL